MWLLGAGAAPGSAMGQQYELKLDTPGAARIEIGPPGRSLAVLPGRRSPLRVRAQKAQRSLIPQDATALEAYRVTVAQCRWHIAANENGVTEFHDGESLHQVRVGLRRLRVALSSAFGGEFSSPQTEAISLRAKSIATQIAPARDLDVFNSDLIDPAARANGELRGLAELRARAERARRAAWQDAAVHVSGPRFRMFMRDLGELVDRGLPSAGQPGGLASNIAFELPARSLADRTLAIHYRKACKRGKHIERLEPPERHKLRIALKKLRYTSEFFAPLFDKERVGKFVRRLGRMQDLLGALNDVAVAKKILESLVLEDGQANADVSFAAGYIYGWHIEHAAQVWKDALTRWKGFVDTRQFWDCTPGG